MARNDDFENDVELELALRLEQSNGSFGSGVPESMLAKLSPTERKEYQQAQECLEMLNQAGPEQHGFSTNRGEATLSTGEADFEVPQRIGKFRVIRRLGVGGFGVVLLAHDESLRRDVAIKIPRTQHLLVGEYRQRFEREAKAAAVLAHPAIVPVYESGCIDHLHYIAFEFCDGMSLAEWLEQQSSIDPVDAATTVQRLADAVQHAHSRGVVHRDLKPGNILLEGISIAEDSKSENSRKQRLASLRLKITDFGLARLDSEIDSLTLQGAIIGTPAYMSPEQAKGDLEVGPTADVYSLGVILYQMLTGKLPFVRSNHLQTLKAICETTPTSPRKINSQIPKDLSAICLKCLEKESGYRYESAYELSADLNRFLNHHPILARRPSALRRFRFWFERNPLIATLTGLLFASLIFGYFAIRHQYHQSQANLKFAESNFQQAKATVDELLTRAMSVELRTQPTVRKEMLQTVSRFYQQFIAQKQDDPDLNYELAVAHRSLAKIDREMGKHSDALKGHRDASELFEKCVNEDSILAHQLQQFGNMIDIGLQLDHLGKLEDSISEYDEAIEFGMQLTARFPEEVEAQLEFARVLKNLGAVLRQLDDMEGAKPLFDEALSIRQNIATANPGELDYQYRVALAHSSLADWYIRNRNMAEALGHASRQLEIAQSILKADSENLTFKMRLPNAMNRLSDVYRQFRNEPNWAENAMAWLRKAEILQRELVEQYPLFADARKSLINTLANQGDVARLDSAPNLAMEKYLQSISLIEEGLELTGTDNFKARITKITVLSRIGSQHEMLGDDESAIECYTTGIEECQNLMATHESHRVNHEQLELLRKRGMLLFSLEEFAAAEEDFADYLDAGGTRADVRNKIDSLKIEDKHDRK